MAKNKKDYFRLLEEQVACCSKAANLMKEIVNGFSSECISDYRSRMHAIEHEGDKILHEILSGLFTEFITPIDQEDIMHLAQIVDDITDALDETILEFYVFQFDRLPKDATRIADIVNRCVNVLYEAVREFKNFKKPEKLRELTIKVNDIEAEGDAAYVEAMHSLFAEESDMKILLGHKAIYESLENCCDMCEHAVDVMDMVVIKNT